MRSAGLVAVVAGCGFRASGPALPDQPADAGEPDSSAVALDAGPGADAMQPMFCAVDGVVACYEFEGNARDGSANGLDATATGVTFVPDGRVGMAMQVDAGSMTNVSASLLFNHVTAVTIEAWIKLSHLPAKGQQSDILDVDNQYSFQVNDDGTLTCDLHGLGKAMTSAQVALDRWTHVACTYDGATAGLIYIDGALAANRPGSGQLTTGNNAMSIAANHPTGMQILGLIDQLRLLGAARTAAQICTDASKAICVTLPL